MSVQLPEISNNQQKKIRHLKRKKGRYKRMEFLIEGRRALEQVINNGYVEVRQLFFDKKKKLWEREPWSRFLEKLPASVLASDLFEELSDTEHPQGVMATVRMPYEADTRQLAENGKLILATDAIQDPGNLGTIIRTTTWFGGDGLLVGKGTVDLFNPKVTRSTAGSTGVLPYLSAELSEVLPVFKNCGWEIWALDKDENAEQLQYIKKQNSIVLIVGNEGSGIRKRVKSMSDRSVAISGHQKGETDIESLNVSISTAIAMYEFRRGK